MENKKSIGLPGGPNEFLKEITQHISVEGYKRYSKDVNNPYNIIESGNITMEDVDFPVMGTDNYGNQKMMYPGNDYKFPGDQVFEVPMARSGGGLLTKTMKCNSCGWKWKAADGGNDVSTCHKCGGEALIKAQEGKELTGDGGWLPETVVNRFAMSQDEKDYRVKERAALSKYQKDIKDAEDLGQLYPDRVKALKQLAEENYMKNRGPAYVNPRTVEPQPELRPYEAPSATRQIVNRMANPITALGYAARGEMQPDLITRGNNAYDYVADLRNPFSLGEAAYDAAASYREDDYLGMGLNALGAIPALPFSVKQAKAALKNTYKINPFAKTAESFNNPNSFYRQIDDVTYKEGVKSGLIKGKQDIGYRGPESGGFNLNKSFGDDAYYKKGSLYYPQRRADYIYDVKKGEEAFIPKVNNRTRGFTTENTSVRVSKEPIPLEEATIYKKDWLQGYKQMPKQPTTSVDDVGKSFNSEVYKNGFDISGISSMIPHFNPLAMVDGVGPMKLSPLNMLPFYGKKLPGGQNKAFRKFGNNISDVESRHVLSPSGGSNLRMGSKQINKEGNWAELGKVNEGYPGTFEATFDFNAPNTNLSFINPSNRNGVLIKDINKQPLTEIPISDPAVSFNRRLPFSERYVPIDKQKLLNNEFQLSTIGGEAQSLIEKYGTWVGGSFLVGKGSEFIDLSVKQPMDKIEKFFKDLDAKDNKAGKYRSEQDKRPRLMSAPLEQKQYGGEYKVKSGDTFYGIANKNNISKEDLIKANPGLDIQNLKLNQSIKLPTQVVQKKVQAPVQKPEETSWSDYVNPWNWGVSDRDDDGDFKQAFRAARKAGEDEFMWYGTRYTTDLKDEPVSKQPSYNPKVLEGLTEKQKARRQSLLNAANVVAKSQNNDENLKRLLALTAGMESTLGADATAYGRNYTRGPMSIDDIAYDDLFKVRPKSKGYTTTQLKQFEWLKSLGYDYKNMDQVLRTDDPVAGMAAARMVYGRSPDALPDGSDPKALYNYYLKYYNKGGVEKHGGSKEHEQRWNDLYNDLYKFQNDKLPTNQKGGEIDNLTIYKNYIDGVYDNTPEEKQAQKVYDKLNRLHYRDAKAKQMTPANYVLTYITG